jgi:catechol 2,3-dioxygenase-like lactoylglutathione lyase family enzyme
VISGQLSCPLTPTAGTCRALIIVFFQGAGMAGNQKPSLGDHDAVATVAVRDLAAARRFYEQTLGLSLLDESGGEVLTFRAGAGKLFVYRSEFAGSNKATAVTWPLSATGVDDTVHALKEKGVTFEHYDLPEMHRDGDVHVAGEMRVAWFKDPDGNIHSLVSG